MLSARSASFTRSAIAFAPVDEVVIELPRPSAESLERSNEFWREPLPLQLRSRPCGVLQDVMEHGGKTLGFGSDAHHDAQGSKPFPAPQDVVSNRVQHPACWTINDVMQLSGYWSHPGPIFEGWVVSSLGDSR
jgi:hypothetical protein